MAHRRNGGLVLAGGGEAGIPVMFLTTGQTSLFASIAERHPQLALIVDHMGVSSETVRRNMVPATIAEVGGACKVSERIGEAVVGAADVVGALSVPERTPADAAPDRGVGPRRCYWGSDVTRVRQGQPTGRP